MIDDGFSVTLFGIDGSRWDVHGRLAGRQGVWLGAEQVESIYDTPIESQWSETAGARGAKPRRRKYLPRDFVLGFHVDGDGEPVKGMRESALSVALASEPYQWDPQRAQARMVITAPLQDEPRTLYFEAREAPELESALDPLALEYANVIYSLRAGEPLYSSPDEISSFERSGTSGSGTILVSNPTDIACEYTVELTPAKWILPDPSWVGTPGKVAPGGAQAARTLPVEVTTADSIARLTRRRDRLLVATAGGTNLLARQQGKFLQFDLPAWLPPTELPISYTGAPSGGARAEYTLPRKWSRPWGGSIDEVGGLYA